MNQGTQQLCPSTCGCRNSIRLRSESKARVVTVQGAGGHQGLLARDHIAEEVVITCFGGTVTLTGKTGRRMAAQERIRGPGQSRPQLAYTVSKHFDDERHWFVPPEDRRQLRMEGESSLVSQTSWRRAPRE